MQRSSATLRGPLSVATGEERYTLSTTAGLGGTAARGGAVTVAGQLARIILQMASVVVLARLLDPADYGLTVMVMAVIGIGEVFRDFGLANAAIQARVVSRRERDNLFWANTGLGLIASVVAAGLGPLLALIYDDPRVPLVTAVLASTFVLNGLSTQFRSDLARRLRFRALVVADVGSVAAALVIAIVVAALGGAYWAIVAQQVSFAFLGLIAVAVMARWVPGPPHRETSIRPFVRYGWRLLVAQLMTYVGGNADSLVVGLRAGPTALGLYDRAFQLLMLPLNRLSVPISRVAVPVLSRLQDDEQRYNAFLLRGQTIFLAILVPVFMFAATAATPLVDVLLGAQWQESAVLFQLLAATGLAKSATNSSYWVALSKGHTDLAMKFSLFSTPVMLVAIVVGSINGVQGVAVAVAVTSVLLWPANLTWYGRRTSMPAWPMFLNGARMMGAFAMPGLATLLFVGATPGLSSVGQLGFAMLIFVMVGGCVAMAWPRFRRDVQEVLGVRSLLRNGGRGQS